MRPAGLAGPLALLLVVTACGLQEPTGTEAPATDVASVATTTTVPVATPPTTAVDAGLPAAPWSVTPLPAEAAPTILKEQWDAAGNKGFCAALYPADANDLAADAVVRSADFGTDAWAVAWDRPEGPGRNEEGAYCEDCGRGAFGIAGTAGPADEAADVWPDRVEWSDGSAAGYGLEGLASPDSGAPYLAYLAVAGQGCGYNAWSFLGEDHLLALLDELRFVEGMLAAVIDDEEPATVTEALGPAPWARTPLGDAAAPAPLLAEWSEEVLLPETCPLLTPVALGEEAQGGVARRAANEGEMLAAWDLPAGPGRYPTGEYCAGCGRGALGLGTITLNPDAPANFQTFSVTHTWDDGSELRIISEATEFFSSSDAIFTDPITEEPVAAPHNGYLLIPGLSCGYRLWSFLGVDHLVELVQNLRPVIGYGAELFTQSACPAAESLSADIDGDGVAERFRATPAGEAARLIICAEDKPPAEYPLSGLGEVLAFGDVDFDGDAEILTGGTSVTAAFYEILTDEGEAGELLPVMLAGADDAFMLIEGVSGGTGYRWGCRDDGTVVQVEGSLSAGSVSWKRTAYRVEGFTAVDVGAGTGTTPVVSSDLADAMFEEAMTDLVGSPLCGD